MSITILRRLERLSAILLLSVVLFSCQKGTEGPAGPQGPAGPAGPQGPTGGVNQQSFQFQLTNWGTLSGATPVWSTVVNLPAITQSVLNTGNVFAYWTQGDQTLLPFVSGGINYMYVTGLSNGTGFIQVYVDKVGIYANVAPNYYQPASLKVVVQP